MSMLSPDAWEVCDFVQRKNDYIRISIDRHYEYVPAELEVSVRAV